MQVLLDENLLIGLARALHPEIEAVTVQQKGWSGTNGELLRLAEREFDVFITMDQGIEFQQNLQSITIAILVLHAPSNRIQDLLPLVPSIQRAMVDIAPGKLTHVGG